MVGVNFYMSIHLENFSKETAQITVTRGQVCCKVIICRDAFPETQAIVNEAQTAKPLT